MAVHAKQVLSYVNSCTQDINNRNVRWSFLVAESLFKLFFKVDLVIALLSWAVEPSAILCRWAFCFIVGGTWDEDWGVLFRYLYATLAFHFEKKQNKKTTKKNRLFLYRKMCVVHLSDCNNSASSGIKNSLVIMNVFKRTTQNDIYFKFRSWDWPYFQPELVHPNYCLS